MTMTRLFPTVLIALDLGAALMYGVSGNWRLGVYWTAAAVLTTVITY